MKRFDEPELTFGFQTNVTFHPLILAKRPHSIRVEQLVMSFHSGNFLFTREIENKERHDLLQTEVDARMS